MPRTPDDHLRQYFLRGLKDRALNMSLQVHDGPLLDLLLLAVKRESNVGSSSNSNRARRPTNRSPLKCSLCGIGGHSASNCLVPICGKCGQRQLEGSVPAKLLHQLRILGRAMVAKIHLSNHMGGNFFNVRFVASLVTRMIAAINARISNTSNSSQLFRLSLSV